LSSLVTLGDTAFEGDTLDRPGDVKGDSTEVVFACCGEATVATVFFTEDKTGGDIDLWLSAVGRLTPSSRYSFLDRNKFSSSVDRRSVKDNACHIFSMSFSFEF
jgi:hypothetical protein